ncbi:Pentatricopeptide repeat domain [Trypanosoma vivax]|uniref:Uncharacterized protein n=1 Tax=Trypanosoma vivax (strain Y486) TaxID=1055687 RepID=G0U0Q4_TRYVY|nr:hypothetical protein TRVL_00016 [Trypanosoma vivax]KAH8608789.1 Pentatricopeptide repeat domain [Trypanosoma vivax]CCC49653.1 conserved hypothetical protein [Trypanosoma vivax Y486]
MMHSLGSLVRRRISAGGCASWPGSSGAAVAVATACRYVHERPFVDLPSERGHPHDDQSSRGREAYETARDALLQLNIMVRRGIEPDALMYTSLIATMARARLEWQAYKLFSRMLESGVRPLPETYVALHDATSVTRKKLRRDLQAKIVESLETFPNELAEAELRRQQEQDRLCVEKFEEYMRGELPPLLPIADEQSNQRAVAVVVKDGSACGNSSAGMEEQKPEAVATMHIRNPVDAWSTAQLMEEQKRFDRERVCGASAVTLADELHRLHEEELRIFLAAQRQLRHGSKSDLVQRVLSTVSEQSIRDMLARRKHYFRSVSHILENDLNALRREGIIPNTERADSGANNNGSDSVAPCADSSNASHAAWSDAFIGDWTLRPSEKQTVAPDVLYTPWGILRKPMRLQPKPATPRALERLERLALTLDELQLVKSTAASGNLDEIPESLLRRYAYQFSLSWKRRHPLSLLEAVQWHSMTLLQDHAGKVSPTPALRRQREKEGLHKTLENYEAFRIISQRTNNLQVVDSKEINLHIKKVRQQALQNERRASELVRRERSLQDAAALVSSAKSFRPPDEDNVESSHVLGLDGVNSEDATCLDSPPDSAAETASGDEGELPPWAICSGEDEFDITSGRFGDPNMGRYQELSDGRFKLLPSREAQKKWVVDRQLLPAPLQDTLHRSELQQQATREAIEKCYKQKLQYKRYRKWDAFLQKAQEKQRLRCAQKREEEEGDIDGVNSASLGAKPLPAKRRFSVLLRKGRDRAPISSAIRDKYNKSL